MKHSMGLYEEPFNSIQAGRKTVEVRLNDEKRRQLTIGDSIEFTLVPNSQKTLTVEIVGLTRYPTFKEMYASIPASAFDTENLTLEEMVEETYDIYTHEQESQWGTLAIEVKLLDDE